MVEDLMKACTHPFVALLATLHLVMLASAVLAANEDPYRGKVAVITGSSSGLGAELTKIAMSKGMKVVLADIDLPPSQRFAGEFANQGGEAVAVQVDLSKPEQRAAVIDAAMKRFGRIDYLFNNAGYSYVATLEQMDLSDAHRLFEVNYWAYVDLAQRAIEIMKKQRSGTIVNVASILGHTAAPPGMGHYGATKHALVGLFETAAAEVKDVGIKIFIASPGGMRTNIGKNSVGPMSDAWRGRAASWEAPEIPARDIFEKIQGDDVVFYPGYQGRRRDPS
jgi:NAD(P)-dependent dehydrogenase (short-subunit alcohol dehydrogenase family)